MAPLNKQASILGSATEQAALIVKGLETPAIGEGAGLFRLGGHAADLAGRASKYVQGELFSNMSKETQEELIKTTGADIAFINSRGDTIKYTPSENLMLFFVLPLLLHQKSQTTDPKNEDTFYKGDKGVELMPWDTPEGAIQAIAPLLGVNEYEIARAYKGGAAPSGRDMQIVSKIINSLESNPDKRALISHYRTEKLEGDKIRKYTIARYEPLVKWHWITIEDKNEKTGEVIASRKERVLALNYVYVDQIADKYVNIPTDIIKRLIKEHRGGKTPLTTQRLLLYLYRELSAKRYIPHIGLNAALNKFAPEPMLRGYKKEALEALKTAIETIKAIGLITKIDQRPGVGGPVLYFYLTHPL